MRDWYSLDELDELLIPSRAAKMATQADAELRRRNPRERLELLRSAEPEPAGDKLDMSEEAVAARVADVASRSEAYARALEERANVMVPSEDPDLEHEGEAWPAWLPAEREAIIQPPRPLIRPRERDRQAEDGHEAG